MKKRLCLLVIPVFFNFCFYPIYAQDTSHFSKKQENYNNHYLKPASLIIPGTLLLYGGLKPFVNGISKLDENILADVRQRYPGFHTNAADYIIWAPSASVYLMDALKVKTRHSFREHLMIDAGSILITGGIGYGMRLLSKNNKVYNKEGTKFPSGHTANAFRGAEIVRQELKESHQILSYGGYLVATGVGLLRIYNKAHLLSEVLAGAGLGILSTKLTYWIFDKVKSKESKVLW